MPPIVNPSANAGLTGTLTLFGVNGFNASADAVNGAGLCTAGPTASQQGNPTPATALAGATIGLAPGAANAQGRCGYGPRLPLMVISPFAKANAIDHTLTDQTSILRFVEDNWLHGQRVPGSFDAIAGPLTNMLSFTGPANPVLILDPTTGQPATCSTCL